MRVPSRDKLAKMAGNDQELIRFLEGLGASGNSATVADGNYGDITVTGTAWEINPGSVGLTEVDGDVLSRQFHTGFQAISTVTGLQTALDGKASVAHNHSYLTLDDLPALGTAAAANVVDFATAAQGALADTASQPGHTHTLAAGATDVTITAANLNALDDGADTALHFHAADRARATHTGTQLAATVSDFSAAADARVVAGITGKQDALVSGTNIKTINGATILGSGDLVVSGGGGGASPIISWMI